MKCRPASSMSATVTLDSPRAATLPSDCSSASTPYDSAAGTCGSSRCSWSRSSRSVFSLRRASSVCCRRYSGRPTGTPDARAGTDQPTLVAIRRPGGVRVQGLGQDLLGHVRPVRVGGVDQVHPELDGPPGDPDGQSTVGGLAPDALARQAHRAETETVDGAEVGDLEGAALQRRSRGCHARDNRVLLTTIPTAGRRGNQLGSSPPCACRRSYTISGCPVRGTSRLPPSRRPCWRPHPAPRALPAPRRTGQRHRRRRGPPAPPPTRGRHPPPRSPRQLDRRPRGRR